MNICMYACMYCMSYIRVCMHLSVYACMYICMHMCIHVCVHVYVIFKLGFERYGPTGRIVLVGRGNCPGQWRNQEFKLGGAKKKIWGRCLLTPPFFSLFCPPFSS